MAVSADHQGMNSSTNTITIRTAYPDDGAALLRLAALDDARPLAGDVLVAEVDGEIAAAVSAAGRAIADPFRRTASLVELLHTQADARHAHGTRRRFGLRAAPQLAH